MKARQETANAGRGISLDKKASKSAGYGDFQALEEAILQDAQQESQQILADARARAEGIRSQVEREVSAERDTILKQVEKSSETERGQAVALAQIEAQTQRLTHREKLLEGVFENARQRLVSAPRWPDYAEIAQHLVRDALEHLDTDHALVRVDVETRKVLGDDVLAELSGDLGVYLRAGEPLERGTGVIVHTPDGHRRYDNRLETRLSRLQDTLRAPVFRILSGEEP